MSSRYLRLHRLLAARFMSIAALTATASFMPLGAYAQDRNSANTATVERFLDSSTSVIGWADISKIDLDLLAKFAAQFNSRDQNVSQPKAVQDALLQLGVTRVFWVTDLSGLTKGVQAGIVPTPAGKAESVALILNAVAGNMNGIAIVDGDAVLVGSEESVAALQKERQGQPSAEFMATANSLPGPHGLAIRTPVTALVPIVSMLPQFAGDDQDLVAQSAELLVHIRSVAISCQLPPATGYVRVTTDSADAASGLARLINQWTTKRIGEAAEPIQFRVDGKAMLQQTSSADEAEAAIRSLVTLTTPARRQARRRSAINSLRHIALAMHNFHDSYGFFPPQALADKSGKRLLSWRVLILPFLDQNALYRQFHLDEPWDSENNRKLIAKMPDVYKSGAADDGAMKPGRTRLAAPLTDRSVFGRRGPGVRIKEIIDGTSNTILITEVASQNAVVWTQPSDIEIDVKNPLASIIEKTTKTFNACMCDGSAHVISRKTASETLNALLTIDGKEAIDTSEIH